VGDDMMKGTITTFNIGDLWSVAAAFASALFILRMESASSQVKDSSALNAASLLVVTSLSLLWIMLDSLGPDFALESVLSSITTTLRNHAWELVYLGAVTTALSNYLQTIGQRGITAERASVIYAMDPVYGAFFANWLLGEQLGGVYEYVGAALITVAAATNAFLDLGNRGSAGKDTLEEK